MFDLTGRTALVTGGAKGLGAVFAKALARQGADIIIWYNSANNEELKKEIEALGVRCLCMKCNVTDTAEIDGALRAVKETFARVDILVNNAGVVEYGPSENFTDSQWNKTVDVDLSGVFKCARALARDFMIPQGYGRIINITSVYGAVGNNSAALGSVGLNYSPQVGYHASKGGVINLTRALGAEWARHNITVNAIAPGYIATGFSDTMVPEFENVLHSFCPMGRLGKTGELESAVVYYACDESSYTTGTTLFIDGGWTAI